VVGERLHILQRNIVPRSAVIEPESIAGAFEQMASAVRTGSGDVARYRQAYVEFGASRRDDIPRESIAMCFGEALPGRQLDPGWRAMLRWKILRRR